MVPFPGEPTVTTPRIGYPMRSPRLLLALALVATFFAGGMTANAATGDPCNAVFSSGTIAKLKAYEECRLDRIEAKVDRLAASPAPSPSSSANPGSSSSPKPSASPSSTTSTPAPSPTAPAVAAFPNAATTGVPAGWIPTTTRTTDLRVTTAGSVVEDLRLVNASLIIEAANVTIRRVEIQGGKINNYAGSTCRNGLLLEQVSLIRSPGQVTNAQGEGALSAGGYSARRVKIDNLPEGFRVGGSPNCGPASISDSFVKISPPDQCSNWHGDGLQGYGGGALTVRNLTIDFVESGSCNGTAPFFVPSGQGNTSVDIDRLLVKGGGYSFRNGVPGKVTNLKVVDEAFGYGPIDVKCSALTAWSADIVTIDSAYQPTTVRAQPCNSNGGA